VLGFWQLRRTPAAVELLAGAGQRA
jgi:hypothetical protein